VSWFRLSTWFESNLHLLVPSIFGLSDHSLRVDVCRQSLLNTNWSYRRILDPERLIEVVDIGALPVEGYSPPYQLLLKKRLWCVFENVPPNKAQTKATLKVLPNLGARKLHP
jgi:hypothetical protein